MVGKGDDCTKYYSFGSLKLHAMVESDDEVAGQAMCTFGHALCGPVLSLSHPLAVSLSLPLLMNTRL
jgi:hypothetical protein